REREMAQEIDLPGDRQLSGQRLQSRSLRSCARDPQHRIASHAREGAEEHVDAFAAIEMRDAENARPPRLNGSRTQSALPHLEVDQFWDDANPAPIDSVEFRDLPGRVEAGGDDAVGAADMHPLQASLQREGYAADAALVFSLVGQHSF